MDKPTYEQAMEWHRNGASVSPNAPAVQYTQAIIDHYESRLTLINASLDKIILLIQGLQRHV